MKIIEIDALQILDSRGNPTLQVWVILEDGSKGMFQVPSGASTGIHEALELRDKDEKLYHGKSVLKAIENVKKVRGHLYGHDLDQKKLDEYLIKFDGTKNKSELGANAILGISIAFAKASAMYHNLPLWEYLYRLNNGISFKNKKLSDLPNVHPFANVINGGLHSGNDLMVQEFMLVPVFDNLHDNVRAIAETYQDLKKLIEEKYGKDNTGVGDEGGFAPSIGKPKEALDLLMESIKRAGYEGKISLALDAAASDFYDKEKKLYEIEKGNKMDYKKLTRFYNDLIDNYPLISIEDPMAEDDFEGFSYFMSNVHKLKTKNPLNGKREILVVGDDLLVTNPERVRTAISKKLCNALLLKINQIGTLSESLEAFNMVNSKKWHTIVSHRSGETTDDFISDLAVALGMSIKLGAPARGERVAKYNRLLNIYSS